MWGIPCFSSHPGWHRMHPLQQASHAAVPAAPSQNQRESEWDLKEKSKREVALSLPELSEIKPSQESFSLSLSLSLFLWIHTSRFTRHIALAVMATLYSHTAGCVIMTVKCSLSLTVDFTSPSTCDGARWTPTHSIVWQHCEHYQTLFFSLFCFWFSFCLRRQLFVGCGLIYCAVCLHVFSFVSGCCLFCSALCSCVRITVWVYSQAQ